MLSDNNCNLDEPKLIKIFGIISNNCDNQDIDFNLDYNSRQFTNIEWPFVRPSLATERLKRNKSASVLPKACKLTNIAERSWVPQCSCTRHTVSISPLTILINSFSHRAQNSLTILSTFSYVLSK